MSAASLYQDLEIQNQSEYHDWRSGLTKEDYQRRLKTSTTLYVGNLSFYTQESQLLELFSMCGSVKNCHMGLNKQSFRPCGFCFVEYHTREEARLAIDCLNLAMLDQKKIRVDWDYGFLPSRRFGRGRTGGQVRDEPARGSRGHSGNNNNEG